MTTIIYDGSFDGWLTAVFEVYEYKFTDVTFERDIAFSGGLFAHTHTSVRCTSKAERVWKGLKGKLSLPGLVQVYKTFLSEQQHIEQTLLRFVQYVFSSSTNIENDYSNEAVLTVVKTAKMVHREKHRLEAFIRFQLTKDKLYYAICQPDFNVLPLVINHFRDRYADQRWLIYDSSRKYGIFYDLCEVKWIELQFAETVKDDPTSIADEREAVFQLLWQQYFDNVNIAARKNMKLHIQQMPKRYWKFLTEKKQV